MFKNKQLMCFVVVGVIVYLIYTNDLLPLFLPNFQPRQHDDEKIISVENFEPKSVTYDTQEAKFYDAQLKKVQELHTKDHKAGALYLKHAVSDTFDLDKTPEELARWKKYVKANHGGLPKIDKSSGEYFKNSCYPTLKYDGIHRI